MTNDNPTPDLSIVIRIEKLMAQAADRGCTPEEREAFEMKAAELIERYRIDRSLIGGHLAADDKIITQRIGAFDGVYGRVRIDLVNAVASAYDVKLFWSGYGNKRSVTVYGFKSDVEVVQALGNRLLADADLRVDCLRGYDLKHTLNERRGFYMGYAQAVRSRLREARLHVETQAKAEGVDIQSVALVLVDRKRQVNDAFRDQHGGLRSAGGIQGGTSNGHSAGHYAGSQVSLAAGNQVGGGRKAIGR
jgi:hypothetical protein